MTPPPRAWLLGALLCSGVAGARLLLAPGHLLATPGGEVWGHAWVQWWHGQALPAWPAGTELALGADPWPVIDPLWTLLLAALGRVLGVVAAWNLGQLLAVALAFLGGAWLARREGGAPLVGGLALGLAPALLGSLQSGLTEDAQLGLAAVALGLVGRPGWRAGLLAGVALAALAACGLVLAWQAALVALAFGALALLREPAARGATLLAGLVAALLTVPVAWPHAARLGGEGHRMGQLATTGEPLWRLNPLRGVDLASLLAPLPQDPGDALVRVHPGYLGLSLLALAAFAGRSRWWAVLVASVLLAPGDALSWMGRPLGVDNPFAAALDGLPGGALVNHHGRLLLIGALALSVLAARGAARLVARWGPRALPAALALVALDLVLLAPGGGPLPVADPTPPDVTADLAGLAPGPLLVLPLAGPGVHFQRPLLDQRAHGRPLLINPTRPGLDGPLARTATGRWLMSLGGPQPAPPPQPIALSGVALVLATGPTIAVVEAALGPPALRGADSAAWEVGAGR